LKYIGTLPHFVDLELSYQHVLFFSGVDLTFRKQTHMSGLIDVNTGLAWVDTTFRCSSSGLCDVFVSSNHFVATPYPHPKKNTEIQDQTGHKHMRNRAQRCPKPSFGKPLKNHSGLMVFKNTNVTASK